MVFAMSQVRHILYAIANLLAAGEQKFGELDAKQGDGDLGTTMASGANAVRKVLDAQSITDIGALLQTVAAAFNRAAPSTLGTLFSAGVRAVGSVCKGKEALTADEVAALPSVFCEEIQKRGKAKLGDKTVLDALIPYVRAFETSYQSEHDLRLASRVAESAAVQGMETTKGMVAKTGRAR